MIVNNDCKQFSRELCEDYSSTYKFSREEPIHVCNSAKIVRLWVAWPSLNGEVDRGTHHVHVPEALYDCLPTRNDSSSLNRLT